MSPTDHKWSYHLSKRLQDAYCDAMAVLISTEQGGYIYRADLDRIDDTIKVLQEAKALHLARIAEQEKERAA